MMLHRPRGGVRSASSELTSRRFLRRYSSGQTFVLVAGAIVVILAAVSLSTDVGIHYYTWEQLQKAADSGALAGATWLPDNPTQAIATAQTIAEANGVLSSEISAPTVAADGSTITLQIQRTSPYYFARVLGLTSTTISVAAQAGPQTQPGCPVGGCPTATVGASSPSQVTGGDNNGNNGSDCGSTGKCQLLPIGLDDNTVYTDNQQITLQQGEVGPGNWDLLALGGTGGNNLRNNIADGYSGPVSVDDYVATEPGKKVGPIDQGIQDRINADPSGTYSDHSLTSARVVVLPVVDWDSPNGRKQVKVIGFASVFIDSYSQGAVTVHFISQVIANSFGSTTASNFGARSAPVLLR